MIGATTVTAFWARTLKGNRFALTSTLGDGTAARDAWTTVAECDPQWERERTACESCHADQCGQSCSGDPRGAAWSRRRKQAMVLMLTDVPVETVS